jgi:hypothetical protein
MSGEAREIARMREEMYGMIEYLELELKDDPSFMVHPVDVIVDLRYALGEIER